jgi:hypothetical protein
MTSPFAFAGGAGPSGVSSGSFGVSAPTSENDTLAVLVGAGGSSPPAVTGVSDTQGNTYTLQQSYTTTTPDLYVWTCAGSDALGTSDSVIVTFAGNTTGAFAVIGADCPAAAAIDVSTLATGSSASPSVSGTPVLPGETALAVFAWGNAGGSGTLAGPFTQLAQQHAGSGTWLTAAWDQNPATALLTASAAITSVAWRAVLVTFEASAPRLDVPQISPGPAWLGHFKPGLGRPHPPVPPPVSPPAPVLLSGSLAMGGMALAGTALELQRPFDPVSVMPGPTWTALFKPGLPRPKPPAPPLPLPTVQAAVSLGTAYLDIPQIRPGPTWLAQFKPGLPKPRSYPPESRILPLELLHGSLAMPGMALSGTVTVDSTPGANATREVWRTPDKVHKSGAVMQ